jgi:FkbM family methyltransferase
MIDIGANIGTYTMVSSSLGRTTISVECYQPNIDRIVRAIQLENLSNYLTLIGNAIYTQSNRYVKLSHEKSNIGGQGLVTNETSEITSIVDHFTGIVSIVQCDELSLFYSFFFRSSFDDSIR